MKCCNHDDFVILNDWEVITYWLPLIGFGLQMKIRLGHLVIGQMA